MSISLYRKPKGRPEQPAKLSMGSQTWYKNRFAAHNQINTTKDLRYKSQRSTTQKFIDQRMRRSSIYKNRPNAKTFKPGFKQGTSRQTAKRTQGICVYMNVCKMSTNLIDQDTEEAYDAEKVTFSFTNRAQA